MLLAELNPDELDEFLERLGDLDLREAVSARAPADADSRALGAPGNWSACCMSMLPRKWAPSAIATRGALISPSTISQMVL